MVVKTHLVDGENDAFVARCKLVVALVGAVASVGSSRQAECFETAGRRRLKNLHYRIVNCCD
jgi:hypothetical protein